MSDPHRLQAYDFPAPTLSERTFLFETISLELIFIELTWLCAHLQAIHHRLQNGNCADQPGLVHASIPESTDKLRAFDAQPGQAWVICCS